MLDTQKLCQILNIKPTELNYLADNIDRFYYLISNPKLGKDGIQLKDKHGKPRTRDLYPSVRLLKTVQRGIYRNILKKIKLPAYAFGGIERRDNILNAKMHQGNKFFFNTDLRNFYPGITHTQVYELFASRGFAPATANILTKLTTYKGQLPQGTPTSPYLANLVFVKAGQEIQEFAKANNLTFTTFVDDITLSGKVDFHPLVNAIKEMITSKGFKISQNKTFYQTKMPKVTNVIVMRNGLRLSDAYQAKIDGFEDKETPQAKGTINYSKRVEKISKIPVAKIKHKIISS
jgi:RNA-directed DNA polymerase